jgi:hypothetical protein
MPENLRSENAIDPDRISEILSDARVREYSLSEDILLNGLYSSILRSVSNLREVSLFSDILDAAGSLVLRSVDILRSDCLTTDDLLAVLNSNS